MMVVGSGQRLSNGARRPHRPLKATESKDLNTPTKDKSSSKVNIDGDLA